MLVKKKRFDPQNILEAGFRNNKEASKASNYKSMVLIKESSSNIVIIKCQYECYGNRFTENVQNEATKKHFVLW